MSCQPSKSFEDDEDFDLSKLDFGDFESHSIKAQGIKSTRLYGNVKAGAPYNPADTIVLNDSIFTWWSTQKYNAEGRVTAQIENSNSTTFEYDSNGLLSRKTDFNCFKMVYCLTYQYHSKKRMLFQIWHGKSSLDTTAFWFDENLKIRKAIGHEHSTSTSSGIYVKNYIYAGSKLVCVQTYDSTLFVNKGLQEKNTFDIHYSKDGLITKTASLTNLKNENAQQNSSGSKMISFYSKNGLIETVQYEGKTIAIYKHKK